jgi:hypothetical protein
MNENFDKAVKIAVRYFALSGVEDARTMQSISRHVRDQLHEGETRPLMLANGAIQRVLKQMEAELEIENEELQVILFSQACSER